jgi:hypothetical protein
VCKRCVSEGGATALWDTHVWVVSGSPAPCHVRGMGAVPRLLSRVRHSSTHWYRSGGNVAVGGVDGGGSKRWTHRRRCRTSAVVTERGGGGGGSGKGWSRKM